MNILRQVKVRNQIVKEATKSVPLYDFKIKIPLVKKEQEISCIIKTLLPKIIMPCQVSTAINSNFKSLKTNRKMRTKNMIRSVSSTQDKFSYRSPSIHQTKSMKFLENSANPKNDTNHKLIIKTKTDNERQRRYDKII